MRTIFALSMAGLLAVPALAADMPTLTQDSGAPVGDNQNSKTAGPDGGVLLEDFNLIEKLARFDRERIPERVVHARGTGAEGVFVASTDFSQYTKASLFAVPGKQTPLFVRFSTVIHPKSAAFKGETKVAGRLLNERCDVNAANDVGQTKLMMAALFGQAGIANRLIAHGAAPTLKDAAGNTAISLAQHQGNAEMVALLGAE